MGSKLFKGRNLLIIAGIFITVIVLSVIINRKTDLKLPERKRIHKAETYTSKSDNEFCFKCHSQDRYKISNPNDSTDTIEKRMPLSYIIDSILYYTSNHWDFKCVDCHSEDYKKTPHDAALKYTQMNTCLDCHGDDETFAKFHFEEIDTSFRQSVHYKMDSNGFGCFSCHDAHYNLLSMRDSLQDIRITVSYANNICLKCHEANSNNNFYEYHSKNPKANIYEKHNWLPALENHFSNVRCVDCHSRPEDPQLVPHKILPKKESVRNCSECHNPNSLMLKTLYKNRVSDHNTKYGFLNPVTLKDQDIIGSNRNYFLNLISIFIFGFTLILIIIHIVFRIIKREK